MEADKYIQLATDYKERIEEFIEREYLEINTGKILTEEAVKIDLEKSKSVWYEWYDNNRELHDEKKELEQKMAGDWGEVGEVLGCLMMTFSAFIGLFSGRVSAILIGTETLYPIGICLFVSIAGYAFAYWFFPKINKKIAAKRYREIEEKEKEYCQKRDEEHLEERAEEIGQPIFEGKYISDFYLHKKVKIETTIHTPIPMKGWHNEPWYIKAYEKVSQENNARAVNFKYYLQWLVIELEHLIGYIKKMQAATGNGEIEKGKAPLYIGKFEENFTETQEGIGRYIQHTELTQLFTTVADVVGLKKFDAEISKQNESKNKAAIVRTFNQSTDEVGTTTKEDTGGFFLPRFQALVPFKPRLSHTYILGASGSGKSELIKLFIYNDIQQNSGTLLLDPHGEIAAEVSALGLFNKHPESLVYITPSIKGYIPKYNPLNYRYDHIPNNEDGRKEKLRLIKVRATELTNAFEVIAKRGFTDQMKNLLKFSLIVLLHHKNMRLADLMDFMNDDSNAKYLAMANKVENKYVRGFFSEGGDFHKKSFEATKTGVRQRIMGLLISGLFADIVDTDESSFDIIQPLKDGKTVVLDLSKGDISKEAMQALGAFFISEVAIWGYSRRQGTGRHVFVYVDECQNFVSPTMCEALAEIRKYRVHFTMANQGLYQFAQEGLPALKDAILQNTKINFIGKVKLKKEQTNMLDTMGGAVDVRQFQTEHKIGKWIMVIEGKANKVSNDTMLVAGDRLEVLGKPHYQTKEEYKELITAQKEKYYVKDSSSAPTQKNKPVEAPHEPKTNTTGERITKRPKM